MSFLHGVDQIWGVGDFRLDTSRKFKVRVISGEAGIQQPLLVITLDSASAGMPREPGTRISLC